MIKMRKSNIFFTKLMQKSSKSKTLAVLGIMTALNVVFNTFLEFRIFDVQFSLTIFISCLSGMLLGSVFGFVSCALGDFIGYTINSWGQIYMPWVGLATALTAFISGVVFNAVMLGKKNEYLIKTLVVALLTFLVCTVLINSTGFYFYNYKMGFSQALIDYVNNTFNGNVGFFSYLAYRLIFKGQIYNSIANYVLLVIVIPQIARLSILRGEEVINTPISNTEEPKENG